MASKKSSPSLDDIKIKFDGYKKEDLENEIIKCIKNINTKEINETYKYEGYFRKNLNHEIEIKKEELITEIQKNLLIMMVTTWDYQFYLKTK